MLYLCVSDETNQRPSDDSLFFIYGGLFIPIDKLTELDGLVSTARVDNGFSAEDTLKFDTRSRPPHVSVEQHRKAKNAVLEGSFELGVRFSSTVVLHEIAKNRALNELVGWGVNTLMSKFNQFLEEEGATGICILDRLPFDRGYGHLRELFQVGITTPRVKVPLNRIHLFATSCEGASHSASVTDIVLGAFRYCVNQREPNKATESMFPLVVRLMWDKKIGKVRFLGDRGVIYRPTNIKYPPYQAKYDELMEHLKRLVAEVHED